MMRSDPPVSAAGVSDRIFSNQQVDTLDSVNAFFKDAIGRFNQVNR